MNSKCEYRQITFDRKLDAKRLQAALSQTMRQAMKNPLPQAAPARVDSVLIESNKTTVVLRGNRPGLDAVAAALRRVFSYVKISKASRVDVGRLLRAGAPSRRVK